MSVLINGMEMPTRCAECWLMDGEDSWCTACRGKHLYPEYRYGIKDRPDWCPLVPVPPHGRLIDADALFKEIGMDGRFGILEAMCIQSIIYDAPTIIPADHIGDVNEMVTDKEGEGCT